MRSITFHKKSLSRGLVLIVVLWVVILLSIILTNMAFSVRTQTMLTSNYKVEHELSMAAQAGVQYAIAVLSADSDPVDTVWEEWAQKSDDYEEHQIGSAYFRLEYVATARDEPSVEFGFSDEAAKLNLHTGTREQLQKLADLNAEQIDSLLDWQDEDDLQQEFGAEHEFYASLETPFPARNRKLTTVEELLLVRGFHAETLYGEDWNQNGKLDPIENDGDENFPPDDRDGILDFGILPYVTIYSSEKNEKLDGFSRVNINTTDENRLKEVLPKLTDDEAKAIVQHRGKNRFENLGELLNVEEPKKEEQQQQQQDEKKENPNGGEEKPTPTPQPDDQQDASSNEGQQPGQANAEPAKKIFTPQRVKELIDFVKIDDDESKQGLININTASERVLQTIPGMNRDMAKNVLSARTQQKMQFTTIADLLDIPGIKPEDFVKMSNHVTVRSMQFRIASTGFAEDLPFERRIVAVVDRSQLQTKILYWREQ